MKDGDVVLSASLYDRFHDGYLALMGALQEARPYVVDATIGSSQANVDADALLIAIDAALAMETNLREQRIWVSDDRCTLVTAWIEKLDVTRFAHPREVLPGATVLEVARRDSPGHTWGPPIKLTEEKT